MEWECGCWHAVYGVYCTLSLCFVRTDVSVYFKMGIHVCKCSVFRNSAFIIWWKVKLFFYFSCDLLVSFLFWLISLQINLKMCPPPYPLCCWLHAFVGSIKSHVGSWSYFQNVFVYKLCGSGSSVGIATDYRLCGAGIESRWGEIFCCPDWPWGPPSLLYNGYRVFPGGKVWPGHDHSPPSSATVMEE